MLADYSGWHFVHDDPRGADRAARRRAPGGSRDPRAHRHRRPGPRIQRGGRADARREDPRCLPAATCRYSHGEHRRSRRAWRWRSTRSPAALRESVSVGPRQVGSPPGPTFLARVNESPHCPRIAGWQHRLAASLRRCVLEKTNMKMLSGRQFLGAVLVASALCRRAARAGAIRGDRHAGSRQQRRGASPAPGAAAGARRGMTPRYRTRRTPLPLLPRIRILVFVGLYVLVGRRRQRAGRHDGGHRLG